MLGKYCENIGLTSENLDLNTISKTPLQNITKGLIFELYRYAKSKTSTATESIQKCRTWLGLLSESSPENISLSVLRTKLYKLEKDKKGKGGKASKLYLDELFCIPVESVTKDPVDPPLDISFSSQQKDAETKLVKKENILLKRKLVRRDDKIKHDKKLKLDIQKIQREKESLQKQEQRKTETVQSLKRKVSDLKTEMKGKSTALEVLETSKHEVDETLCESTAILEETITDLKTKYETIKNLEVDNDYLQCLLRENAPLNTMDEQKNAFNADTVQCVMNLLSCNVAAEKVPEVLKHVCTLCNRIPTKLPSRQTVDRISDMRVCVSQKQLESLGEKENLTLYSDETSKFGKSFEVFAVSDEQKNSYLLGLREMYCKSASSVLDTFKEILGDIENVSMTTNTGNAILSAIKNTMSDRAATEKKFHSLLESYRLEILPKVNEGWGQMSEKEQQSCGKMNNFFCGLHILVNFADVCAEALRKFEHLTTERKIGAEIDEELVEDVRGEKSEIQKEESGTLRLIRCCSKAFAKGADEKSGVYGEFKTYVESKNDKLRFIRFKHNRFNILFLMGDITYHHRLQIQDYLNNYRGGTNRLLRTIMADIQVPIYIAGCRALGIISKLVTAPLWRAIENTAHILEMNDVLIDLHDFLEKAKVDSSEVLSGKLQPFDGTNEGTVELLEENAELDDMTVNILQCLFEAMLLLLKKQASDHLRGGKYFSAASEVWEESRSSLRHNKLPEFFFGQLDFLMKYRPNATALCNEAFIMFSHNRTGDWLAELETSERDTLMDECRSEGRRIRKLFQGRIKEIERRRLDNLRKKQHEMEQKRQKTYERKEKMTSDILYFGLWQSESDVEENLLEIKSMSEKMKALKAQFTFRKKVLLQSSSDKTLFLFSVGKKKRTFEQLKTNLIRLILESKQGQTKESTKNSKKPLLVGKKIKHKFDDQWYFGQVLSVVPSFVEWYNVKYDDDPAIYVYKLQEDYQIGDIQIVPQAQA